MQIAAFDIDGTIITTKSGRTFAKDKDDWQMLYAEVPGKLKELVREGFKIVFLTNQVTLLYTMHTAGVTDVRILFQWTVS